MNICMDLHAVEGISRKAGLGCTVFVCGAGPSEVNEDYSIWGGRERESRACDEDLWGTGGFDGEANWYSNDTEDHQFEVEGTISRHAEQSRVCAEGGHPLAAEGAGNQSYWDWLEDQVLQ